MTPMKKPEMELRVHIERKCIIRWPGEERCQNVGHMTLGVGLTNAALGYAIVHDGTAEALHFDVPICHACMARLRSVLPTDSRYFSIERPDPELVEVISKKVEEIGPMQG